MPRCAPWTAREVELGITNGHGQTFAQRRVIAAVPETQIVSIVIDEALRLTTTDEGDRRA